MPDSRSNLAAAPGLGACCAVPSRDAYSDPAAAGLLSGGCCAETSGPVELAPMSRRARRSRALAGAGFLVIAGGIGARRLPGRIALWPASLVPTWFGISHLLAGVTGYQGCPEIGAIPSVLLGRQIGTTCELWRRIDSWVDSAAAAAVR
jgi:hypothetical protein